MLQILDDPSPLPPKSIFLPEFYSFIDISAERCSSKANSRAGEQKGRYVVQGLFKLLSHPFIRKHDGASADFAVFVRSIFDPTQRLKDLADMLTRHYYLLFDGPDELCQNTKTLYNDHSIFSFSGKESIGPNDIFKALSNIRSSLVGEWPPEKQVHIVEKLQCRAHDEDGVAIRVSGSSIVGNQFLICGDGIQVGVLHFKDLSIDIPSKRMGSFRMNLSWKQ